MGIYNLAKWEDLLNKYLESPILKFWKSMLYQDVSQFLLILESPASKSTAF